MTSASRKLQSILMGTAVAVGLGLSAPAGAEELRIGYLAPTHRRLRPDRQGHGRWLPALPRRARQQASAAWTSSSSSRTSRASRDTAVTKAKKLVLQDKVHMFIGGLLASTGYALAPVSTELTRRCTFRRSRRRTTSRSASSTKYPVFDPHQLVELAAAAIRSANGPATRATRRSSTIAADYAFGYEVVGGFQKAFEDCGGKIVQKIWPPLGTKDFGPLHPDDQGGRRRDLLADGRPDVAAIPQANARRRLQEADHRRRHQL